MSTDFRRELLTWIALLVLLALTCGSAFLPLGRFNVIVNFAIAAAKAALVAWIFMRLRRGTPLLVLVAGAGLVWLSLLVGLTGADYVTR